MKKRSTVVAATFGLLMLGTTAVAQTTDTVVPHSGSPLRGKIVSTSRTGLTLQTEAESKEISANTIRYIVIGGEPSSLRQIRDAANEGNSERAQRYLDRLDANSLESPYSKSDYQYYKALVQKQQAIKTGQGLKEAAQAMLAFVSANPKSFQFYNAAEALGDLAVAMNRPDGAAKYYGQLEKAPWPEMQFRGAVRMAAALRAQGGDKLAEALKRYDAIISATVESEEALRQKQFAIAGKASCQAEMGEPADGIAVLQPLIAETSTEDTELLAVAYNALGDCHRAAGQPKDALLAYLHVDLLFSNQLAARAEALYHISQLWKEMGREDRAEEAKQTLRAQFEGSSWARLLK